MGLLSTPAAAYPQQRVFAQKSDSGTWADGDSTIL